MEPPVTLRRSVRCSGSAALNRQRRRILSGPFRLVPLHSWFRQCSSRKPGWVPRLSLRRLPADSESGPGQSWSNCSRTSPCRVWRNSFSQTRLGGVSYLSWPCGQQFLPQETENCRGASNAPWRQTLGARDRTAGPVVSLEGLRRERNYRRRAFNSALTVVPRPGADSTSTLPASRSTRSRMPMRPKPPYAP